MNWYLQVLKNYAVFSGRARRKEYWMFVLFNTIFAIVAMILDNVLGIAIEGAGYGPIYGLYTLAILIPGLAVGVRRLHDVGKSGWFMFIALIPIVGGIWLLVLFCKDGDVGTNKYGANPKEIKKPNVSKLTTPRISRIWLNVLFGVGIFLFGWLVLIPFYKLGRRGLGWLYYGPILILIILGNPYHENIAYMIGSISASGAIHAAYSVDPPFVLGNLAIAIHAIAWIHASSILKAQLTAYKKTNIVNSQGLVIATDRKQEPKRSNIVFIVIAALVVAFLYFTFVNPPTEYSIGQIDNRFGISKNEAVSLSKSAAYRWNKALGKKVLVYDANASLKIDFIYDQRQADVDKLRTKIANLNNTKQQLEQEFAEYETDLEQYNRDVQWWNYIGGAPEGTYQILQQKKLELQDRISSLMRESQLLNNSIQTCNSDLANLEETEAGVCKQQENKIEVYAFANKRHLRLILMHEFGHALGAGHTNSPTSIMYSRYSKQNLEDPRPLKEDIDAVKKGL